MLKRTQNFIFGYLYKPSNFYSLEYMIYLYDILSKNQVVENENLDLLVQIFKELPELLVFGEKHSPAIVEKFKEKNMVNFFLLYLNQRCGSSLIFQIYQALNIIFENIKNPNTLDIFINDNVYNFIITNPHFLNFDEILALYISSIKILVMKINQNNISKFVNSSEFPVLVMALKYFDHKEIMVCVNVRSIVLILLKLQLKEIDDFFDRYVSCAFFSRLIWNLKCYIDSLSSHIIKNEYNFQLENTNNELCEIIQYINDIINVASSDISKKLIFFILKYFFTPLRVLSLKSNKIDNPFKNMPFIAAFIFSQMFQLLINSYVRKYIIIEYLFNKSVEINESDYNWTEPEPLDVLFKKSGIGVKKYCVTERLKNFLSKLYYETQIVGYVLHLKSDSKKKSLISEQYSTICTHDSHDLSFLIHVKVDFKNFSYSIFADLSDERLFYFAMNFLSQIYNYINEDVFLEIFGNDIDNFILYQLTSILDLIRYYTTGNNIDHKELKFRPAFIFEAFFLYFTLINKFKSTANVITNSSILSDLINLLNSVRSIIETSDGCLPLQDNCLITNFFYCIREYEFIISSPELFSNCYQMFLDSKSQIQSSLPKYLYPTHINIFIKFFTYLNLQRCIEMVDNENHNPIFHEICQLSGQYHRAINTIHSSDYEIISCFIITMNEWIHGFMALTETHIILAKPAPSPHYGSLTVVYSYLFNIISIYPNRETDSFVISVSILESLKNSKQHSDFIIKLKFISDETAKIIYEKLHSRILKLNQRVVDLLRKLGIKIENNKELFSSIQSQDYCTIKNKIFPINITSTNDIIAEIVNSYEENR